MTLARQMLQPPPRPGSRRANHETDDPPYLNIFDTKNGILIADANFREDDSQRKLNWSELMYQTWALANITEDGGGPISNLRSIVRSEVVNKGTKAVFELAYGNNRLEKGEDGPEDWREWNEASHGSFFLNMLATDNVKGVVWLLTDHAAEMGRKEITSIYSRWTRGNSLNLWYAGHDRLSLDLLWWRPAVADH